MKGNGQRALPGANQHLRLSHGATAAIKDLGIPRDRASRAMQVADIPNHTYGTVAIPHAQNRGTPTTMKRMFRRCVILLEVLTNER
jgi:hypothetical protein